MGKSQNEEEADMPTESAQQALSILRDGSQFQWYVIPLFAIVVYVYANEIERKNWNLVFAGLAYFGMDLFNEIWNSLVFHFNGTAPVWGAPGDTAYLVMIGWNIEILFMFAIAGVAFGKMLPEDKQMKVLGIPNRLAIAVGGAAFCVFVEVLLNQIGALTWDFPWWDANLPWLIFLFGYLHFFLVSFWVHDMERLEQKLKVVGGIFAFNLLLILVFGVFLGWL
jgi:hypothetical protein